MPPVGRIIQRLVAQRRDPFRHYLHQGTGGEDCRTLTFGHIGDPRAAAHADSSVDLRISRPATFGSARVASAPISQRIISPPGRRVRNLCDRCRDVGGRGPAPVDRLRRY